MLLFVLFMKILNYHKNLELLILFLLEKILKKNKENYKNMDHKQQLLNKIKENTDPERIVLQEKAIDRMDRASLNMQYLTETLLWLSRKEMQTLPVKQFELNSLLEELVEERTLELEKSEQRYKAVFEYTGTAAIIIGP